MSELRGSGRTTQMIKQLPHDRNLIIFCRNDPQRIYIRNMIDNLRGPEILKNIRLVVWSASFMQQLQGRRRNQIIVDHAVYDTDGRTDRECGKVREFIDALAMLRD